MGADIEILCDEQRLRPQRSEVERLCASREKAQRLLGWQPRYAGREGLRGGLTQTIVWFRDPAHLKLYRPDSYTL
jgi:dTDP-glucose 4,6-dehydratase